MPEHNLRKISQHLIESRREIRRTQEVPRMWSCIIRNDIRRIAAKCMRDGQDSLAAVRLAKLFYPVKQFLHPCQNLGL